MLLPVQSFLLLCATLLLFSCTNSQVKNDAKSSNTASPTIRQPSSFFPGPKAKILVVGTFHFNYPGLDAFKTAESDKVDVLLPQRQKEMTELVEYIKRFRPNKIVLESKNSARLTQRLRSYKADTLPESRNEIYQIGFRVAKDMELDTLYGLDTESLIQSVEKETRAYFDSIAPGYDFHSNSRLDSLKLQWYAYEDQLKKDTTLLAYFKHLNSPEYHAMDYGMYLIGDFKIGDHGGADVLAAYWYSRNLRLFRKIQDIVSGPQDRIMVLFGNAHASLLRQYLSCSPEFEYVEFSALEDR